MKKIIYLFSFFFFNLFYQTHLPILNVKPVTLELKKDIYLKANDFLNSNCKNIQFQQLKIDCDFQNKVGTYPVTIQYQNLSTQSILLIQDTTAPIFTKIENELTLYPNEDILSYFKAKDESKCRVSIQEKIDPSKPIDTIIHIEACDQYQNKTIQTCHLIIKEKKEEIPATIHVSSSIPSNETKEEVQTIISNPSIPSTIEESQPQPQESIEQLLPACEYSGSVGNSGLTFSSYGDAISYADSFLMNNLWTYSGYSVEKIGCPDIWTIHFY